MKLEVERCTFSYLFKTLIVEIMNSQINAINT